jgi:hypothetical protein
MGGLGIGPLDTLIAAQALRRGGVPGLQVENWHEPDGAES